MASSVLPDSTFEDSQISSSVSAEDAPAFFQEQGVFYQADADLGRLVTELDSQGLGRQGLVRFKPLLLRDLRIRKILEPYLNRPPFLFLRLGSDPGTFFAFTKDQNGVNDRLAVYIFSAGSVLEFSLGSNKGESKGVAASIGLVHIPYRFLRYTKKLEDVKVRMERGGILIVHPRLAVERLEGYSLVYGLQKGEPETEGSSH